MKRKVAKNIQNKPEISFAKFSLGSVSSSILSRSITQGPFIEILRAILDHPEQTLLKIKGLFFAT